MEKTINKTYEVIKVLYNNRSKLMTQHDIMQKSNNVLTEFELQDLLNEWVDKGIVNVENSIGTDGDLMPFMCYILNRKGIQVIEKNIDIESIINSNINEIDDLRTNECKLTIPEIALKQFFIFKYENGKEIVKGNALSFFKGTEFKTTSKLIKKFNEYKNDSQRLHFVNSKREDTKLLNEQIKRYAHILPYLKVNYEKAYIEAHKEYKKLNEK